jgi:hypothetical protein
MNNDLAAAEAEIRGVLAEGGDDSDPLKPLALVLLTPATGNLGHRDEADRLVREAEECARRRGPDFDYDLGEALWNRCFGALYRGTTDRGAANEYLELARNLGNAHTLAGALIVSALSDPESKRGMELMAQGRELAARAKDNYRYVGATWFFAVLADDPQAAIRTMPELVQHAASTGQRIQIVVRGRELLRPLATMGRYDAVAVLDGATPRPTIRPTWAAEAKIAARNALGEDRYAQLYDIGRSFSPADLEEYLRELVSELS